eukprot:96286-Amphidinium_carterae.2
MQQQVDCTKNAVRDSAGLHTQNSPSTVQTCRTNMLTFCREPIAPPAGHKQQKKTCVPCENGMLALTLIPPFARCAPRCTAEAMPKYSRASSRPLVMYLAGPFKGEFTFLQVAHYRAANLMLCSHAHNVFPDRHV